MKSMPRLRQFWDVDCYDTDVKIGEQRCEFSAYILLRRIVTEIMVYVFAFLIKGHQKGISVSKHCIELFNQSSNLDS